MKGLKENPIDQKIYCKSCDNEISFETCDKNNGLCDECQESIDKGDTITY